MAVHSRRRNAITIAPFPSPQTQTFDGYPPRYRRARARDRTLPRHGGADGSASAGSSGPQRHPHGNRRTRFPDAGTGAAARRRRPLQGATSTTPPRSDCRSCGEAIAGALPRPLRRVSVPPERVVVTAGSSAALLLTLALLVNRDEQILLADPGYPCTVTSCARSRARRSASRSAPESDYQLTAELVARAWTPRTRGALIASPSNPTGTTVPLGRACAHRGGRRGARRRAHRRRDLSGPFLRRGSRGRALALSRRYLRRQQLLEVFQHDRLAARVAGRARAARARHREARTEPLHIAAPRHRSARPSHASRPETLEIVEARRREFQARRDFLVPALRRARVSHSGHADRRLLRLRRLLGASASTANASRSRRSKPPALPSLRASISAATGPRRTCASPTRSPGRCSRRGCVVSRLAADASPAESSMLGTDPRGSSPARARSFSGAVLDRGVLLAGHLRRARSPRPGAADSGGARERRPIRRSSASSSDVLAIRDYASREARAPGQRELSPLHRRSIVRFVLWNVFATPALSLDSAAVVLPRRRLRELSRLLCRSRRAGRGGAARGRRGRRLHRRCAGVFHARLLRRSHALDVHPLSRHRDRAAHLPRAGAPGRLRQGRHGLQRVLRGRGRGRRRAPLARATQHDPDLDRAVRDERSG